MATKVRTLKKAGEPTPFVSVELKKYVCLLVVLCMGVVFVLLSVRFLPVYCAQHIELSAKGEEKEKA